MKLKLIFIFIIGIVFLALPKESFAVNVCWDGGGGDNNWNTGTNWDGDSAPGSGDVAVFDSTSCTSGSPNKNVTINVDINVQGINITNYTGIITQGNGNDITLGSSGYSQSDASSTFTGGDGTSDMTIGSTGDFSLSAGSFTAPAGTVTLRNDWTISGGTFSHNNGEVKFNRNDIEGTSVITGNATFYDLSIEDTESCSSETYQVASGTTITVNNNLTFNGDDACGVEGSELAVDGPGEIHAKGDVVTIDLGMRDTTNMVTVTINGTGAQALVGENDADTRLPNITIDKSSGTLTFGNSSTTARINIVGDWTYTQGDIDASTHDSEILFGEGGDGFNHTITGSMSFNDLTFIDDRSCDSEVYNIASGTTITVEGTLTFNGDGACGVSPSELAVDGPGEIHAKGDVVAVDLGVRDTANTVTVTINGTGAQALVGENDADTRLPNITIDKSSGTLTFGNSSTTARINIVGDWTYTQGDIDASTHDSEIIFDTGGESSKTLSGSMSFNDLTFTDTESCSVTTYTISSGTTLTAEGDLTLSAESDCNPTETTVNGPGSLNAQGDLISTGFGAAGDVPITLNGSNAQSINVPTDDNFPSGTFTINKTSGTATFAQALSLDSTGQDMVISSGTLDSGGFDLTVDDVLTMNGGTFKLINDETITTGSKTLTGGTVEYTGTGTYSSLSFGSSYYNVTFSGSGTFSPNTNLDVDGSYTQSAGTFNVAPSGMSIGVNLTISGGTYDTGSSTVTFDSGSTSVVSGNVTFYNLTSITAGKTIQFTAGETFTVSNDLTLRGEKGSLLTIESTTQGTQWNINVNGSDTLSYLSVEDSNACGGDTTPLTATGSTSVNNNECWDIEGVFLDWYDSNWSKRRRITIDHTQVAADHTDFPVLISFDSDTSLSNNAQADGDDILFTTDDGSTKLSHEVEYYSSGTLDAWVKISSLSSTEDTVIYMYYGNSDASNQEDAASVWDDNFVAVQHLEETTTGNTDYIDSTSNANNSTSVTIDGDGNPDAAGQVDGAVSFDGSNDTVIMDDSTSFDSITSAITMSAWVTRSSSTDDDRIISKRNSAGGSDIWMVGGVSTDELRMRINETTLCETSNDALASTGVLYHVVATFDQSTDQCYIYVNGSEASNQSSSVSFVTNDIQVAIAHRYAEARWWPGIIDEVKVSNTARSANWIQTEYNNQSDPDSFYTLGEVATSPQVQIRGGVNINGGTNIGQ